MNITLNISLNVSKNYLPEGVAGMHLQYGYVKEQLEKALGTPIQIGLALSTTEKTIVVQYSNVELVLRNLYWIARDLQQDYIAYSLQDGAGVPVGGALVGKYAHEWNYGIFNEEYFIAAPYDMRFHIGLTALKRVCL